MRRPSGAGLARTSLTVRPALSPLIAAVLRVTRVGDRGSGVPRPLFRTDGSFSETGSGWVSTANETTGDDGFGRAFTEKSGDCEFRPEKCTVTCRVLIKRYNLTLIKI